MHPQDVSWQDVLSAYRAGMFPMAASRDSERLEWYSPLWRGILPLDAFHIPRSLARFMKRCPWRISMDEAFARVIHACAETRREGRDDSWINADIERLYTDLHRNGYAHSVEVWAGERLIGGLYGVSLGAAFFGESMFSLEPNASKVALVHLVRRLQEAGFTLLDTQYVNDHLRQFGVRQIPRRTYHTLLADALMQTARF